MPDGIEIEDGRGIIDTNNFVTHALSKSVALFSDLFRFHMIRKIPGIIWVDTDIYCHRPIDFDDDFLFGFEVEKPTGGGRVNGAVLRLPSHSKTLNSMLEFMEDLYPVPEWLAPHQLKEIKSRAVSGNPMHVSEMIWGIWGPVGLTAHLRLNGEIRHAKPRDVFYPVHFPDRNVFFRRPFKTWSQVSEQTKTIHLWAPIKKVSAKKHGGLCKAGSFLEQLVVKHNIDPAGAPTPVSNKRAVVE